MYICDLVLADFRNYERLTAAFEPGISVLIGPNGQGKTNLVEAIGYLATMSSHRVPSDTALVRAGAEQASVGARLQSGERTVRLECDIKMRGSNKVRINGAPARRPRDLLGICHVVSFAPEDLSLVKADPDGRRAFIDSLVVQLTPRLAAERTDYDRVLKQRTALLKSAGARSAIGRNADQLRTLDTWDAHLARHGARIISARLELVRQLAPLVAAAYREISGLPADSPAANAAIEYRSSLAGALALPHIEDENPDVIEAQLIRALAELRGKELERGQCLVGPHRDDLYLTLGPLPAKGYASHGESWSFALALKIAAFRLLSTQGIGDARPILVLDDVFAELDASRRSQLIAIAAGAEQAFVTAAAVQDVPEELDGARFDVMAGEVSRVR